MNYVTNEVNKADQALALQGTGIYARYQVSPPAALALRYERLDDEGLFGGIARVLHELTATAEYTLGDGFLVRGEFRRDWSNVRFFTGPRPDDRRANTAVPRKPAVPRRDISQGRRGVALPHCSPNERTRAARLSRFVQRQDRTVARHFLR